MKSIEILEQFRQDILNRINTENERLKAKQSSIPVTKLPEPKPLTKRELRKLLKSPKLKKRKR